MCSNAMRQNVSRVTKIDDIFVYKTVWELHTLEYVLRGKKKNQQSKKSLVVSA